MDSSSIPLWIAFCVCLICSSYFSSTESAMALVNRIRMKSKAEEGNKRAKRVLYIVNHFDKALTTILVGNNVVNTAAASIATLLAARMFAQGEGVDVNSMGFTLACTAVTTLVVFLFGEVIPKTFAGDRHESWALTASGSLRFLMRVLTPVSAVFSLISKAISKLFKAEATPSITEEELIEILDTAEEEGVVDEEQNDIFKSAMEFDETVVGDVMTMAKDVKVLNVAATHQEILQFIRESIHSRVPVYSGSPDNIIGTLRVRRYLTEYRSNPKLKLRALLSPPHFVREKDTIDDVLSDMRQHKHHIAIVVDDRKKMLGLATIEDFLEELVGEIFDEEDIVDQNFQSLGGNKYLVNVNLLLGNAFERMGLGVAPRAIASKPIISFLIERLGHRPVQDEVVLFENLEFTIQELDEQQIVTRVEIHILDEEDLEQRRRAAESDEEVEQ